MIRTLAAAAAALALLAPSASLAQNPLLLKAHDSILKLDVSEARQVLSLLPADSPDAAFTRALLSIYEGDCDAAMAQLERHGLTQKAPGSDLAEIARGCAHVTAATTVVADEKRGFLLRFKDEDDVALAPFLMDAAEDALATLERDLQTRLPRPVRIDVVRDHFSLAAMTGLPEESAQTTGTVAIAKWGRVTMLSPRAMPHGYAWADTLAHELTHLSITRATRDRAPLWLQEGLAKREETRWRAPFPFDGNPSPDALARLGFDRGLALPLDKLGPSIAMLPTAEQAMIAFAEVSSFLRYWVKENGDDALGPFLRSLADAPPQEGVNVVLQQRTGADLAAWSARWQKWLPPAGPGASALLPSADPSAAASARSIYRSGRLAELLSERGHLPAATRYAHKTQEAAPTDPSARARLALLLRAQNRPDEAEKWVSDLEAVSAAHGVFLALYGAARRHQNDDSAARHAFVQARYQDPLDAVVACEALSGNEMPNGPAGSTLCQLVRRR